MSLNTLKAIENGRSDPKASTLKRIANALQAAGVQIIEADQHGGPGVRLRKP